MTIGEAKPIYYANRKQLVEQTRTLFRKKQEAEQKYNITGDTRFSEEATSLSISLEATKEAFEKNQDVLDSLMTQETAIFNMENSKLQGEAMEKAAADMGKVIMVFRRLAHGDIVPQTDEKKLMEYDFKMYTTAKNMQMMAQRLDTEKKKHKSLWEEEEEKVSEDPMEIAENSEYAGTLPDIEIPDAEGAEITE